MNLDTILILAVIGTTVSMTGAILYQTYQMKKSIRNYLKKGKTL